MFKSITTKVVLSTILLVVIINAIILVGITHLLPEYFINDQLSKINAYTHQITSNFDALDDQDKYAILNSLQIAIGGDLYSTGASMQHGFGKHGENRKKMVFAGDFEEIIYTNNLGHEVFAFAVKLSEGNLIYEVSVHSLTGAVAVMNEFMMVLLVISILLGIVLSLIFASNITRPIRALNQLAFTMRRKQTETKMVTRGNDEIAQLNQTLNSLYEELLSNIYQLESELDRERHAEQLKKRFLAQATHELKTPIAVIQGYSELLEDGMYKNLDEKEEYIKNIYVETKNITSVMNDILDYTSFSTTAFEASLDEVDLVVLLRQVYERFLGLGEKEGVKVTFECDCSTIIKYVDPMRIEQAVKNLLMNALEHAKSTVKLKLIAYGDDVVISVYNDGDAIREDDLPYIFDSFYKTKGKKKGSGLGLSIVKEIIGQHSGDYRVENKEKGVEFTLILK